MPIFEGELINLDSLKRIVKLNNPLAYYMDADKLINIEGKAYKVEMYEDTMSDKDLDKDKAYIYKDYVLPYRENEVSNSPGIYNHGGKLDFILPSTRKERNTYSIDSLTILDPDYILSNISGKVEISNNINALTKFTINEDDNALMKLLKQAINEKEIDINNYKIRLNHLGNTAFVNHMKPLKNQSALSFNRFVTWCEILDLEWKIVLQSKKDVINSFDKEFVERTDDFEE